MKGKIAKIIGYIILLISVMILPLLIDFGISYYHVQQMDPEIREFLMGQAEIMMNDDGNSKNDIEIPVLIGKDA